MQWDDMRLFLGVARNGGLSGGARSLRLDPATLGRRMARLEADVGAALFVKGPSGYRLTETGARVMDHAERAETAFRAAHAEAQGALSGAVRIGAPDGCATYLLPQVTAALARENPALRFEIVALPRVLDLNRREADMAIAVSRPTAGRIAVQKIADYRLSLAAHRDYLAARPVIASVADLAAHRIVGYVPDMIFDSELDYLSSVGIETVHFASSSVAVQARWIAQGAGVGIVHDFTLRDAPGVVRVLPREVELTRSFWLLRPVEDVRAARLDTAAAALVAGLRAEIAQAERCA